MPVYRQVLFPVLDPKLRPKPVQRDSDQEENTVWCIRCQAETENPRGNPFLRDGKLSVDTCENCPIHTQEVIPPEPEIMPQVEKIKRGLISVINCQRCNKKITVDRANPDLTHCYSCSKKLVDDQPWPGHYER